MAELHLIGQITEVTDFPDKSLFLKWTLNAGANWSVLEGFTEGQSQLSYITENESDTSHGISHPIDVHYVTDGLQGWPRFEYQVWGVDWLGKCNISAYGFMSLPTKAGNHELTCSTWRPVGDFRRRLMDYITGYRMHLLDPSDIVGNGLNRHVIQTLSMGYIKAEITLVMRNFDKYGIDV